MRRELKIDQKAKIVHVDSAPLIISFSSISDHWVPVKKIHRVYILETQAICSLVLVFLDISGWYIIASFLVFLCKTLPERSSALIVGCLTLGFLFKMIFPTNTQAWLEPVCPGELRSFIIIRILQILSFAGRMVE